MRSIGRVEGLFNLMVGVESFNIGVEVTAEFFFGCGESCAVVRNNFLAGFPLRAKISMKASLDCCWHISQVVRLV